MAVFTALRTKVQSGLAGLVTGAAKSALGLNRAAGLRFPDVGGSRPSGDSGNMYQYPLDLGATGNSHFISFFVRAPSSSRPSTPPPDGARRRAGARRAPGVARRSRSWRPSIGTRPLRSRSYRR